MTSIPFDYPHVRAAVALIPSKFHARCWIAGSAACRWPEAWDAGGDLDVWVVGLAANEEFELLTLLTVLPLPMPGPDDVDYANGSLLAYTGDRTHILLTRQSIEEVVKHFDIACHAGAVALDGRTYRHPAYSTHPTILSNQDGRFAQKSLARAFKFAARYNDWALWEDSTTQQTVLLAFDLAACTPQQKWMLVRAGL